MYYFHQAYYQENSYGISCVYEIARLLNESGIPARVVCTQDEEFCKLNYKPLPKEYQELYIPKGGLPEKLTSCDTLVIQDVFDDRIPTGVNLVRWLLNKPICLSGKPIDYLPTEYVIAYSNYINENLPQLFVVKDERRLFQSIRNSVKKKHSNISVYFGKVHLDILKQNNSLLKSIIRDYENVNIITRCNPGDRMDMLKLLAQSEFLISFDPLSNTNYEACLLGTPTLMLDDSFNVKNIRFNIDNSGYFFNYPDLENAKKSVAAVFSHYCDWLEVQNQSIIDFFSDLTNKINKIANDPAERNANAEWNKALEISDKEYYNHYFNSQPFVCINTIEDLPPKTAKLLGVRKDEYNWKKHVIRTLRNKMKSLLRTTHLMSIATKIYTGIKSWKNKNYTIPAAELSLPRLFYFTIRRIYMDIRGLIRKLRI